MSNHPGNRRMLAAALALFAVTACDTRRDTAARSDTTSIRRDTTTSVAGNTADLTDAEIAGIVLAANSGDSTLGALASTRATNSAVKQFAQRMVREHGQLNRQVEALARRLNVTANTQTEAVRDLHEEVADDSRELMSKTGADFDREYIDEEIEMHEAVLRDIDRMVPAADNAELRSLLTSARSAVQSHLDQAKSIKTTLR